MPVVTATISDKSGTKMDPTYELMSIDIEREVGRVPRCALRLIDGDLTKSTFPISDTPLFEPGAELSVSLRYETQGAVDAVVFKGLVVRHGLEIGRRGAVLHVELRDRAVALTRPRRSAVHVDASDAEVIGKLATAAGLTEAAAEPTKPKHPQLVQYQVSDWDFMLARAEANGLVFAVTDGAYTLARLAPSAPTRRSFELGKDELFDIDLAADGLHQPSGVQGLGWDVAAKAATAAVTAAAVRSPIGNLDGARVASALGFATTTLNHPAAVDPDELKAWVDGRLARSRMAMVCGRLATRGFAEIALLDVVELIGVGARFTGKTVVTGIRHRVTMGGWQTDLQLGFSPDPAAQRAHVIDAPAAGLLPAVTGLQVGVVAAFEADPLGLQRVKVLLPGIDAAVGAVWARLATPDAGPGRGYLFRPYPGDEVVVGFFNSDPRQPVILGAMFGKVNKPPPDLAEPEAENPLKGIFSKKGVSIGIVDDDKPGVFIETPAKNKIVFDDAGEMVQVSDQAGNTITLDKHGITLTSAKDVLIEGANITIKGSKVDVK
jgi:Rhs element Vgr protein